MKKAWIVALVLAALLTQTVTAQDAKTVISTASKAMGVEGLNSIHYYGVAQNGNLGQNNNANQPWPVAAANDYVRAIDFTQPASRATWHRSLAQPRQHRCRSHESNAECHLPSGWRYVAPHSEPMS